jgi:hypothetical protein
MTMIVQDGLSYGDTRRPNERCQVGVASLPLHIEERDKVRRTKVQRRQQSTVTSEEIRSFDSRELVEI